MVVVVNPSVVLCIVEVMIVSQQGQQWRDCY